MDANLKAKWIAALRSGEYQQGAGLLFNEDERAYCCLGVLCAVSGLAINADDDCVVGDEGRDDGCYFTIEAMVGDYKPLARLNDSGKSFAEIADYIEANIP